MSHITTSFSRYIESSGRDLLTRDTSRRVSKQIVTYSFRRRSTSYLCDLLSPSHESYARRRCEGPMEGRSIIHKMHVLERSFLPELKYSTSHSYHPHPARSPVGFVSLREFHRVNHPRHQSHRCRPIVNPPFHAHTSPAPAQSP